MIAKGEKDMTYKEIDKSRYYCHHKASRRGYVSRKLDEEKCPAVPYNGKFGKGFVVCFPRWDTTKYCTIAYMIERPTQLKESAEKLS